MSNVKKAYDLPEYTQVQSRCSPVFHFSDLYAIHLWSNYKRSEWGRGVYSSLRPLTALSQLGPLIMIDLGMGHILLGGPILNVLHHQAWLNALKALKCLSYNMASDLSSVCGSFCVCVCVCERVRLISPAHIITHGSLSLYSCHPPPIISVPLICPIKGV